jgi:cytochrome P450
MERSQLASQTRLAPLPRERGVVPGGPSFLFFLMRARALADPHRILDVFREIVQRWGPIASSRSGLFGRTYLVGGHSAVATIFRANQAFTKYPRPTDDIAKLQAMIGKGMLATPTDEEWASHRQAMAPLFARASAVKHFATIVTCRLGELLDEALGRGAHVANVSELAMRLSGRVMSDLLAPGHRFADENFLKIKQLLDQSILEFHRWDFKRRAGRYKTALREQAAQLVETAAADPAGPGLVQRMMVEEPAWRSDSAARERLLDRTINLVVAGYETTATTLNWVTHLIASDTEVQMRLCREVDDQRYGDGTVPAAFDDASLLRRAIAEAMRLHPALWFNIRYATQETVVEGARFLKGSRVMLLPFIANRSEAVHADPGAFRPDRYLQGEPPPLFPFGNGPRACIGRTLAELEMQAFVVGLVRRFRLTSACSPKAIGGVLLQPDQDIKVHFHPRPLGGCRAPDVMSASVQPVHVIP